MCESCRDVRLRILYAQLCKSDFRGDKRLPRGVPALTRALRRDLLRAIECSLRTCNEDVVDDCVECAVGRGL